METKHTPGPWEEWSKGGKFSVTGVAASLSLIAINSIDLKDCAVEVVAQGSSVAIAFGNNKEEAEANARLIAAAPELLAIALRLVDEGLSMSLVKDARAVIAKSGGAA